MEQLNIHNMGIRMVEDLTESGNYTNHRKSIMQNQGALSMNGKTTWIYTLDYTLDSKRNHNSKVS
jgi:hypothetical protein